MIEFNNEPVIFLGDTHFGVKGDSEAMHKRFEVFYRYLFKYMIDNDIKTIIQFGDLFDRRKYINFNSLNRSHQYFFDKIVEYDMKMVALVGNHDLPYKNSLKGNSPSLLLGKYENNISVVQKPEEIKIGDVTALAIPWMCLENEKSCLEAISSTSASICLGHFELAGFEMYSGVVCEHGMSKEVFDKFDHVYSGHFHHISTRGNITYIGSPYQLTWADYGDPRGFFLFDPNNSSIKFEENPFKNFVKLKYDDTEWSIDDIKDFDFSSYDNATVKVIVINKSKPALFDEYMSALEASGAIATVVEDHKYKNLVMADDIDVEDITEFLKSISKTNTKDDKQAETLSSYLITLYNDASHYEQEK